MAFIGKITNLMLETKAHKTRSSPLFYNNHCNWCEHWFLISPYDIIMSLYWFLIWCLTWIVCSKSRKTSFIPQTHIYSEILISRCKHQSITFPRYRLTPFPAPLSFHMWRGAFSWSQLPSITDLSPFSTSPPFLLHNQPLIPGFNLQTGWQCVVLEWWWVLLEQALTKWC